MSKLRLLVEQEKYQGEDRIDLGVFRDVVSELGKELKWKGAKIYTPFTKNVQNTGNQLIIRIIEVNKDKAFKDLDYRDINAGSKISDLVRSKEIGVSTLLDFPVIEHTNEGNGAVYPLVVSPSNEASAEANAKFSVDATAKASSTFEQAVPSIEDLITL